MKKIIKIATFAELMICLGVVFLLAKLLIHDAINHGSILYRQHWGDGDIPSGIAVLICFIPIWPLFRLANYDKGFKYFIIGYLIVMSIRVAMLLVTYIFLKKTKDRKPLVPVAIIDLFFLDLGVGLMILISNDRNWVRKPKIRAQKEEI